MMQCSKYIDIMSNQALMAQEKEKVEVAIQKEQDSQRKNLASNNGVSLEDFDELLQPIITSCTKDSIAVSSSAIRRLRTPAGMLRGALR